MELLYYPQVLTKEYYGLQTSSEKRLVDLEANIAELRSKLEVYEKLETELDDVVMQAAESKYNTIPVLGEESLLFVYSYFVSSFIFDEHFIFLI